MALVWRVVAVVVNMRQVVCVICNLPALPHTIPVVVFYSSNGGTPLLSASQLLLINICKSTRRAIVLHVLLT